MTQLPPDIPDTVVLTRAQKRQITVAEREEKARQEQKAFEAKASQSFVLPWAHNINILIPGSQKPPAVVKPRLTPKRMPVSSDPYNFIHILCLMFQPQYGKLTSQARARDPRRQPKFQKSPKKRERLIPLVSPSILTSIRLV